MAEANQTATARKQRRRLTGKVTSAKASKTRRVEVMRLAKHPKYGKIQRHVTICHVHDEKNEAREGDQVEIMECRPMSKTKRWRLVRVLRSHGGDVVGPDATEPSAQV